MISMLCAEYNYRQSIIQNYFNLLSSAPVPPLFSSLFVRIPNRFSYQNLSILLEIWWNKQVALSTLFCFYISLFSFVVLSGFSIFVYQHTYTILGDNPRQQYSGYIGH